MSRLRVLLCTGEFPPDPTTGGIGTAVRAAAAALARAGLEVHVLHVQRGVDHFDRSDPYGFVLHRRPLPGRIGRPLARSGLLHAGAFRFHADRLGSFDLVEAPEWEAAVAGFTVRPRQPSVAVLYTPTEVVRLHGGSSGNRTRERIERWGVRRADAVISCGPTLAELLSERGWRNAAGRLGVQPPCLAPEQLCIEPAPLGCSPKVLGIGRLEPRKGFELLVQAAARLSDDVEIVLVGRDVSPPVGPSYGRRLVALAGKLGVRLRLVPPMPSSELGPWFNESWLVAVPSSFESFSMVALEAAAHGRAVVTSDAVGFSSITGASDGIRIAPQAPDPLASTLAPLVEDRAAAERAGFAARATVRDIFGPAHFAARRMALYGEITASS